jgi:DNA-binding transcriptional MerR regulator
MPELVPETLDNLLSVREAASLCGVAVSTVHGWAHRGLLEPSDIDPSGHRLYKMIDVLRAARDTRQRAIGKNRLA